MTQTQVQHHTTTITTKDGTQIYYKDWGAGQPVVFSHGWPLSADAWEDQMVFLGAHGYRCIAHDRRGHGRSSQPWNGNEMDTYADDLATLVESLDLRNAIHVGHSTGGGRGGVRETRARSTAACRAMAKVSRACAASCPSAPVMRSAAVSRMVVKAPTHDWLSCCDR